MNLATIFQYWVIKNAGGEYMTEDCEFSPYREDAQMFLTKQQAFSNKYYCDEGVYRISCPEGLDIDLADHIQ